MREQISSGIRYFLCGLGMGAADVVPGISGGTIAFITGIYDQLLNAIKSVNAEFFRNFFTLHIKKCVNAIPWSFLIPLLCGIAVSFLTLAKLVLHFMATSPEQLWAFFFGLIVASIILMLKGQNFHGLHWISMIIGGILGWIITGMEPGAGNHSLPFIFASGFIALCAMILPGISGSFILVIMGQYAYMLSSLVSFNFIVIIVFLVGGVCGIMSFSRVLSFFLKKYPFGSHAFLIGIMGGCLRAAWPWRANNALSMPQSLDYGFFLVLCSAAAGILLPIFIQMVSIKIKQQQ